MNTTFDPAAALERPKRRGFWRRLFSWTALRRLLLGLVALFTLAVVLITIDNRRAARAWQACKAKLEARGEVLDWRKLIPPPVPDEENFAATPLLQEIFAVVATNDAERRAGRPGDMVARVSRVRDDLGAADSQHMPSRGDIQRNERCDLEGWAAFYAGNTNYPAAAAAAGTGPAKTVLAALSRFDGEFDELRQAAARPRARFNVNYDMDQPFAIWFPHLTDLRAVNRTLSLRATARLADGQADAALSDWKLGLRLIDALRDGTFLIGHLVRIAMLNDVLQVVQEGLARRVWTPAQLEEIERSLAGLNLIAGYGDALRAERAGSLGAMESLQRPSSVPGALFASDILPRFLRYAPLGWVDYNKITLCDWFDRVLFPAIDEKAGRIDPGVNKKLEQLLAGPKTPLPAGLLEHRRTALVRLLMPAVGKIAVTSGRMQSVIDHARIACALERQRLAGGPPPPAYPETLAALVPAFLPVLPHDPVTGGPYPYRREGTDGYVLYSVGGNATDDGGRIEMNSQIPPKANPEKGDWVWRWPPQTVRTP